MSLNDFKVIAESATVTSIADIAAGMQANTTAKAADVNSIFRQNSLLGVGLLSALNDYQEVNITPLSSLTDAKNYFTAALGKFQPKLVSGINIKTINEVSLLGNGNVAVQPKLYLHKIAFTDSINDPNRVRFFASFISRNNTLITKNNWKTQFCNNLNTPNGYIFNSGDWYILGDSNYYATLSVTQVVSGSSVTGFQVLYTTGDHIYTKTYNNIDEINSYSINDEVIEI